MTYYDAKRFATPEAAQWHLDHLYQKPVIINPRVEPAREQFGEDFGKQMYNIVAESIPTGRLLTLCTNGYMYHV
ncbi:MAG: hypothetical protein WCY09_08220 [Candidatus Omnitrophota bacterium]